MKLVMKLINEVEENKQSGAPVSMYGVQLSHCQSYKTKESFLKSCQGESTIQNDL